jgi:hypothetical protein
MAAMIVATMIVTTMIAAVILAVPVAFVHLPSTVVMIVVGVGPIGAWVWPSVPSARIPLVAAAYSTPVSIDPDEAFARKRGAYLITNRRRGSADVDVDLSPCGGCGY